MKLKQNSLKTVQSKLTTLHCCNIIHFQHGGLVEQLFSTGVPRDLRVPWAPAKGYAGGQWKYKTNGRNR